MVRTESYGPRSFRHEDGSLRAYPPAAEFYTVATRKRWAPLVTHCRTTGGLQEVTNKGYSIRYGIGVSRENHQALVDAIGLPHEETVDDHGTAVSVTAVTGTVPEPSGNPLQHPDHAFNSYFNELARAVLGS